jgi:hypothetical protein
MSFESFAGMAAEQILKKKVPELSPNLLFQ